MVLIWNDMHGNVSAGEIAYIGYKDDAPVYRKGYGSVVKSGGLNFVTMDGTRFAVPGCTPEKCHAIISTLYTEGRYQLMDAAHEIPGET